MGMQIFEVIFKSGSRIEGAEPFFKKILQQSAFPSLRVDLPVLQRNL